MLFCSPKVSERRRDALGSIAAGPENQSLNHSLGSKVQRLVKSIGQKLFQSNYLATSTAKFQDMPPDILVRVGHYLSDDSEHSNWRPDKHTFYRVAPEIKTYFRNNVSLLKVTPHNRKEILESIVNQDSPARDNYKFVGMNDASMIKRFLQRAERLKHNVNQPHANSLKFVDCPRLKEIPDALPKDLKSLKIADCGELIRIMGHLPRHLETLKLEGNTLLTAEALTPLPDKLKKLNLDQADTLGDLIHNLPSSLEELAVRSHQILPRFPHTWPTGLISLTLEGASSSNTLFPINLPSSLNTLAVRQNSRLDTLRLNLPNRLETLDLSKNKTLKRLEGRWPPTLKTLDLRSCPVLLHIPPPPAHPEFKVVVNEQTQYELIRKLEIDRVQLIWNDIGDDKMA